MANTFIELNPKNGYSLNFTDDAGRAVRSLGVPLFININNIAVISGVGNAIPYIYIRMANGNYIELKFDDITSRDKYFEMFMGKLSISII